MTGRRLTRSWKSAGVAVALALAATASGHGPINAADEEELIPLTIGGTTPSFTYAVPLAMMAGDYDGAVGLDIDYIAAGSSSTNLIAGVLSDEYQLAVPSAATALDAMNQGADLMIVAGLVRTVSVLVVSDELAEESGLTADSPLEDRVLALRGKTVVSSPDGSGNNTAVRQLLQRYGLDPDNDVEVIGLTDTAGMVAGLRAGHFDAGFYGSGVFEANVADGSGVMWVRAADIPGNEDALRLVIVGKRSYIEANPEIVDLVREAVQLTLDDIHADPDKVGQLLQAEYFTELDREIFDISWANAISAYPDDPGYTRAAWDLMVSAQAEATGNDYSALVYEDVVYEAAQD